MNMLLPLDIESHINLRFVLQDDEPPAECQGGDVGEVSGRCVQRRREPGVHAAVPRPLTHQPAGTQRLDGADARRSQRTLLCSRGAAVTWVQTHQ